MILRNIAIMAAGAIAAAGCTTNDTTSPSEGTFELVGETDISASSFTGTPIGTPTSLKITVYALYLSVNEDCTDLQLIKDYGSTPREFNMIQNPKLFSGSPAAATYKCMVLKMQDTVRFKADADAVAEDAACGSVTTEHTIDIYRQGEGGAFLDLNGDTIPARGSKGSPVADIIYTFASTDPSAIAPTTAHEYQVNTMTALTVPGSKKMKIAIEWS
jgi:hypothetical protein